MKLDTLVFVAATLALATAAVLAGGCDGAPTTASYGETRAAEGAPTLGFDVDWSIAQSGPVVGGGTAVLHYDPARLPACRATYHGFPAWGIVGYWNADGGFGREVAVTQFQNGTVVPVDATIRVPFGRDLQVWFFASDEYGCTQWDSDYGRNFHFAITPPPEPVIHFAADWSNHVDGTLGADRDLLVDYDLLRLPTCRATYNEYQTWEVTAHARFDDGTTADAPVTEVIDPNGRGPAPARFHAPAGTHAVELWFENTDRTGCQAWDSDYGQNYRFSY
jgi:hypothetical protein